MLSDEFVNMKDAFGGIAMWLPAWRMISSPLRVIDNRSSSQLRTMTDISDVWFISVGVLV